MFLIKLESSGRASVVLSAVMKQRVCVNTRHIAALTWTIWCLCVCVCVCVFLSQWGLKPECTHTHGDSCHSGPYSTHA